MTKLGVIVLTISILLNYFSPNFVQACDCSPDATIVQTIDGKVQGSILTSRDGRPFYAYRKIPFAKPPVGDLRFKAPVAPQPWANVLDATKDGPVCIQKNYLFHEKPPAQGEEDCLYINVYSPRIPIPNQKLQYREQLREALPSVTDQKRSSLLPVMVFIHPGGFFAGTGNSDYLGPQYFMDKEVIVVTFNYRLGVFGFLSTTDDASPGNWALKDQVAALKWVQANIAAFGGNKDHVTIFGESAGSGSVHLHMVSPRTNNLFHHAISQSGSALSLWAKPNNKLQADVAKRQAEIVGCDPLSETNVMVECLRKVDAKLLANSADEFKEFFSEPLTTYGPVTEVVTAANPEPYITKDPLELIQAGEFKKIPFIIGDVSDEGIIRAAPLLRNSEVLDELNKNFNNYGPNLLLGLPLSVPPTEVDNTWKAMVDKFLTKDSVDVNDPKSVQGFIDMYSDRSFHYPAYQSALLHAWRGHSTVWFYYFDYKGAYTYGDHFAGTTENIDFNWGVCHTDDLLYLFSSPKLFSNLKFNTNDDKMSRALIQMWTDFAIHADPSPNNEIIKLKWNPVPNLEGKPKVTNSDLSYLNIVGRHDPQEGEPAFKFEIKNDFLTDRMLFWESLPLAENIPGIE